MAENINVTIAELEAINVQMVEAEAINIQLMGGVISSVSGQTIDGGVWP